MYTTQTQPSAAANAAAANAHTWPGHMADDVAATYGPEPTARLVLTADALILSGPRGEFRVPRSAVRRLGRSNFYPWFFSGLRIHHAVSGFPQSLQFKPLEIKSRDLLAKLRELGLPAV